jgi:hypothetical protein
MKIRLNTPLTLLTFCVFLLSCTVVDLDQERTQFASQMAQWNGQSIDALVERFGHAESLSESPSGNRVFVYMHNTVSSSPVYCSTSSDKSVSCSGGDISQYWCKGYFEVNDQNTIVDVTYKGNLCGHCSADLPVCLQKPIQ